MLAGSGSLTMSGGGTATLSGANTYTGATFVSGGTLAIGPGGSIAASSGVNLTSATAVFDPFFSQTIQDLSGVAGSKVTIAPGSTLTLGAADSTIFAGVISGFQSQIVKQGAGTLALSGANTYSGGTTLNGGVITVENNSALGTGTLAMAAGTTLSFMAGTLRSPTTSRSRATRTSRRLPARRRRSPG